MCLTMLHVLPLASYTMIMYDDVCMYDVWWYLMQCDNCFDETVHGRPTEQIMSWY